MKYTQEQLDILLHDIDFILKTTVLAQNIGLDGLDKKITYKINDDFMLLAFKLTTRNGFIDEEKVAAFLQNLLICSTVSPFEKTRSAMNVYLFSQIRSYSDFQSRLIHALSFLGLENIDTIKAVLERYSDTDFYTYQHAQKIFNEWFPVKT